MRVVPSGNNNLGSHLAPGRHFHRYCPDEEKKADVPADAPKYSAAGTVISEAEYTYHQLQMNRDSLYSIASRLLGTIERECCLLVLNTVTSTPQWICQRKPRGCHSSTSRHFAVCNGFSEYGLAYTRGSPSFFIILSLTRNSRPPRQQP